MTAHGGRPDRCSVEWEAAVSLADAVAGGGRLPELTSPVLLEPGEVLHASIEVDGWRFQALDVVYEQRRGFAIGGLLTFGLTAAVTARANRRARERAEALAVAQWRPLGRVPVWATSHRLLVLHEGAWGSVWYEAIRQVRPTLGQERLELLFEDDPPYGLQGPWVPYLAVVLTTALAERLGTDAVASALLAA